MANPVVAALANSDPLIRLASEWLNGTANSISGNAVREIAHHKLAGALASRYGSSPRLTIRA
jgi:hypothetical protein